MPKYFFNVRYGRQAQPAEGEECPDKDAAWEAATIRAGTFLRQWGGNLKPGEECEIEVTDELKNRVYLITINSHEFGSSQSLSSIDQGALLRRDDLPLA